MTSQSPFQILTLDKYNAISHGGVIKTTYLDTSTRVANSLERKEFLVSTTNIFGNLIPDSVIFKMAQHTTEQLVLMGYQPTYVNEFKHF